LLTGATLTRLMDEHDLRPSRARGQHFLSDPNTARRIARLAGVGPGDRVVEIGAGLGSLTLALAATGAAVTAVEVDRRLLPALRQVVAPAGVRIVEGDALDLPWDEVLGAGGAGGPPAAPAGDGPGGRRPGPSSPTCRTTWPPPSSWSCWRGCRPSPACS
ncbi:MAG: rRNA adenine N-6-methyltransferase family protein, partial [Acidimicrobiales bacterium]